MSEKTKKLIGWSFTGLIALIFSGSAFGKLTGEPTALKMATEFGFSNSSYFLIGVVEIVSLILFIIPRTGVIGTLFLAAYMGGAIATHVQHNESIMAPAIISAVIWLVGAFRFPEILTRLSGK